MDDLTKAALADGKYVAYTAGCCKPNPGPGGCAYLLFAPGGDETQGTRISVNTTGNIAQLQAVIDALSATPEGSGVLIRSASSYITDTFGGRLEGWAARGWRNGKDKPVANRGKWQKVLRLSETRQVSAQRTSGQEGDPDSKRVVELAGKAAERGARKAARALRGVV